MNRLRELTKTIALVIKELRVEDSSLRKDFNNLLAIIDTPLAQAALGGMSLANGTIAAIRDALLYDKQVLDITQTIANIFECFSVDRFVGVESENGLEDMALKMNGKKLFLAGIYFDNDGEGAGRSLTDYAYKLRMDIDNTPVTIENRNRLWFPGPDGNFELQMRYHRGFIQVQHIIDQGITKTIVDQKNALLAEDWKSTATVAPKSFWDDDEYEDEEGTATDKPAPQEDEDEDATEHTLPGDQVETTTTATGGNIQPMTIPVENNGTTSGTDATLRNQSSLATTGGSGNKVRRRKKRSPQVDFLSLFLGGSNSGGSENTFTGGIKLPEEKLYTKQFPYKKYRKDFFLNGVYLSQAVQLAFFFALIIQVSAAVRHRIWMRESGNSTVCAFKLIFQPRTVDETVFIFSFRFQLMRIMGLERTSENISWILTTLVEMSIVFLLCEGILYVGGILDTTNPFVVYIFLLIFAFCVIAFW